MFHIAQWLGANIESQEGRQFLAELGKASDPKAKAALLTATAKRHGLDECLLARTWEKHAAVQK